MTPALALVTVLILIAVGVYLWRGWRALDRLNAQYNQHIEQALNVVDEQDPER